MSILFSGDLAVGSQHPRLFFWASLIYSIFGVLVLASLSYWRRAFGFQLSVQVIVDVLMLTLLLYASGGGKSGLAMMILVVLVGAGLVGQGRMVLFYAAFAALCLLLEQAYRVLELNGDAADFFRTGLTSMGFFGSAIAARLLARKVVANEELARQRGIELADQMRINERVIRDMQDGVLVADGEGRLRQANPQALALLGLEVMPQLLANCAPALAGEYLERPRNAQERETLIRIPRTGRILRVRFLPPGEGGNVLIFLEDTSRQEAQAQQLKLAALGRLTANLAHEIRNPLAAISQAAELLGETPDNSGAVRLTGMIGNNVQRLNRLVSEVMELGRRDRAYPESIDVLQYCQTFLEELGLKDPALTERVALEIPERLMLCFDRGHFQRVLANLIGNALQFASQEAGAVRLSAARSELTGRVDIHISDDGPGIADAVREKIFEPFFTTRAQGTGLGLYIARELSEANGADLILLPHVPGAHFCLSCKTMCNTISQGSEGT